MRALVIDDSKAMRMIIGRILKEIGFEVMDAADGQEALQQVETAGPFDLAMVDWNMPVMSGLEFVKAVRETNDYASMKMMMVTTETELDCVAEALEAGADEYTMKPFTKDVILEKLAIIGIEPIQA